MKTIVVHSNYPILNKDSNMLRGVGHKSVRDFLNQMVKLTESALVKNIRLISSETSTFGNIDGFMFIDCPDFADPFFQKAIKTSKPLFLLVWESDLINHNNHSKELHAVFDAIFTYDDSVIDDVKYFKIAYNFDFPNNTSYSIDISNRKLLCLISGNNHLNRSGELYTLRRNLVDWYSVHHPLDFHLYGVGWGKIVPPRKLVHRVYNKFKFLHPIFSNYNKCYQGEVEDKIEVGRNYKFQICFENSSSQTGYVSEKIFHAFFSKSIPIYYGAPNIKDLIPDNCFIDFNKFNNFYDLHAHISEMSQDDYLEYIKNVNIFLNSEQSQIFNTTSFCTTVVDVLAQRLCL